MRIDSLAELDSAFRNWRKQRRHIRERIPEKLLERARRTATVHSAWRVAQTIGVAHARLTKGLNRRPAQQGGAGARVTKPKAVSAKPGRATVVAAARARKPLAPPYSRLEISAPAASARPVAEVETPAGIRLRIFQVTPETVALLSTVSASGGAP